MKEPYSKVLPTTLVHIAYRGV